MSKVVSAVVFEGAIHVILEDGRMYWYSSKDKKWKQDKTVPIEHTAKGKACCK